MNLKKYSDRIGTYGLYFLLAVSIMMFIIAFTGINSIFVYPLVRDETPQPADVIIVLGGGVVKDTRSLPWSVQERMRKGIMLYRYGYSNTIIAAGGLVKGKSYTESEIMRAYAELLGVAPGDIFEESASRNTHENAVRSLAIMENNSWKTALIVTSDYHTKRACRVFEKQGAFITCVSAPPESGFDKDPFRRLVDARSIFREYFVTLFYLIRGYI